MGEFAKIIYGNTVGNLRGETAESKSVKAELAIKKSIAKIGREFLSELRKQSRDTIYWDVKKPLLDQVAGVKEILARIKKL